MMMMGLHFMGEVPFRRVLLHGMVVDETGDKMSKVKGNVIDPLDLIHGATLRRRRGKGAAGRARARRRSHKFKKALSVGGADGHGLPGVRRRRAALHASQLLAAGQAHRALARAHRGLPATSATRSGTPFASPCRTSSRHHTERTASGGARAACESLDPLAARARRQRERAAASTSSASTRLGALSITSSGTSFATGTSSSIKPVFAGGSDAQKRRNAATLAHVLETSLRRCTRSCRSSPRSSGSGFHDRGRAR